METRREEEKKIPALIILIRWISGLIVSGTVLSHFFFVGSIIKRVGALRMGTARNLRSTLEHERKSERRSRCRISFRAIDRKNFARRMLVFMVNNRSVMKHSTWTVAHDKSWNKLSLKFPF